MDQRDQGTDTVVGIVKEKRDPKLDHEKRDHEKRDHEKRDARGVHEYDRFKHSYTGLTKTRGLPKKGGAGTKFVWGKELDQETDVPLDPNDPDYDDTPPVVYRLVPELDWKKALENNSYTGSEFDAKSGFIHLSAAAQAEETARRYFQGVGDLLLIEFDTKALGPDLKWETAEERDDVFPHLYAKALPVRGPAVRRVVHLPIGPDGQHVFPQMR